MVLMVDSITMRAGLPGAESADYHHEMYRFRALRMELLISVIGFGLKIVCEWLSRF